MFKKVKGFFLIEVVVTVSIISVVLILMLDVTQDSVSMSKRSLEKTQASFLLEEGVEAVKSIRAESWNPISSIVLGTTYYLSWNGSVWSLTTTPQSIDKFSRSIVCSAVYRNVTDDIVLTGGTLDAGTKNCSVTVLWNTSSGEAKSEQLSFLVAKIYE